MYVFKFYGFCLGLCICIIFLFFEKTKCLDLLDIIIESCKNDKNKANKVLKYAIVISNGIVILILILVPILGLTSKTVKLINTLITNPESYQNEYAEVTVEKDIYSYVPGDNFVIEKYKNTYTIKELTENGIEFKEYTNSLFRKVKALEDNIDKPVIIKKYKTKKAENFNEKNTIHMK